MKAHDTSPQSSLPDQRPEVGRIACLGHMSGIFLDRGITDSLLRHRDLADLSKISRLFRLTGWENGNGRNAAVPHDFQSDSLRYFTFRKDSRKWTGIRMGVNVNKTGRDDFSGDIHPRAAITLPLRADRDNFSVLNTQISLIGGRACAVYDPAPG